MMKEYLKFLAKTSKWTKWPVLFITIVIAGFIISENPKSDTHIGTVFACYFQLIFAFTIISAGLGGFYFSLILENLPDEYYDRSCRLFRIFSPVSTYRFLKLALTIENEKIRRWAKKAIFLLYCTCSILITAPLGTVIFLFLTRG